MTSKAAAYIVIALAFTSVLFLSRDYNVFSWISATREIRSQEKLARRYRRDIIEAKTQIDNIKSSRDSLEKLAREEFHLCAPGEDVYLTGE